MLTGPSLPLVSVLPFAAMLLAIAVCPLGVPEWWASNRHKAWLATGLAAPVVLLYLARRPPALLQMAEEYVSFLLFLTGLYVIAGGIHLEGGLGATPRLDTAFLGVGAVLAAPLRPPGPAS